MLLWLALPFAVYITVLASSSSHVCLSIRTYTNVRPCSSLPIYLRHPIVSCPPSRLTCVHGDDALAVLGDQVERAVEHVADVVGQRRVDSVTEALLAEVTVLSAQDINTWAEHSYKQAQAAAQAWISSQAHNYN